jgi:uncharacterized alpha-E superfamily protein
MMLARVADSLYWIGRYVERAEHLCRLCDVMLNATLDRTDAANQVARITLAAAGHPDPSKVTDPYEAVLEMTLDRENDGSIVSALASARENARQVRDQITTETWERLNLLYLRMTGPGAARAFADGSSSFLNEAIADLHLFKGAADATMSHGEGWSFLRLGVHLERAQLIGRLLEVCYVEAPKTALTDHFALTSLLRMSCALEPYLRVYTADIQARYLLEFLLLDEEFPRSIRFCTQRIEEHLSTISRHAEAAAQAGPDRLAGRLKARLQYADMREIEAVGAGVFLTSVLDECSGIHQALHDAFVAYPLELRLPA